MCKNGSETFTVYTFPLAKSSPTIKLLYLVIGQPVKISGQKEFLFFTAQRCLNPSQKKRHKLPSGISLVKTKQHVSEPRRRWGDTGCCGAGSQGTLISTFSSSHEDAGSLACLCAVTSWFECPSAEDNIWVSNSLTHGHFLLSLILSHLWLKKTKMLLLIMFLFKQHRNSLVCVGGSGGWFSWG